LLQELDEQLYIPQNDRELRIIQRKGDELDRRVRRWSENVIELLPQGLPMNADERNLLALFLSQQRRLNTQMDAFEPDMSIIGVIRSFLPFLGELPDPAAIGATHRIAAQRLESDIDRTARFFCEDHSIPADCEEALDWRVAIRFMAQSIYSRVSSGDLKKIATSPRRFELALVARDLSSAVVDKRHMMFAVPNRRLRVEIK
jgi:hypothetical protein